MKNTKHIYAAFLCFILLILAGPACLYAQSGIYAGGPVYQQRSYSISELRNSGFKNVIVWTIHIDANGNFNFNAEFPLVQNGSYVGAAMYPNFASDMTLLKTAPTSINRIDFCLSAWGSSTFANIKTLINAQGTGPTSALYKNFQALKNAIPAVDAIGFDDESTYDASTATALAVMLGNLGFKVSLVPYTNATFWTTVAANTNAQRPGTVDRIDLQCYDGGASNTPCGWNFGSVPVYAGLWDINKTPAQVQSQLTTWKNSCNAKGGFMWLYDDFDNTSLTAQYATAINNAFSTTPQTGVFTAYKDCNYTGAAVSLPAGNYTLSQLESRGIVNDDISSLRVTSGYRVQVYWDDNFLGSTLTFTSDNDCLVDEGWNDKISSLKVTAVAAVAALGDTVKIDHAVYPNPATSELTLKDADDLQGASFSLTDKNGHVLTRGVVRGHTLDVSALPADTYILRIGQGDRQIIRRFVKE